MGRPDGSAERRRRMLPELCLAFQDLGYHRATTASIARRLGVRENVLYRLWPDKKAMFLAALRHVRDLALATWTERGGTPFSLLRALDYEAGHVGRFGNYRILFAALSEPDDHEIRSAVREVYRDFHAFIARRAGRGENAALIAWGLIGLGTASTLARELGLASPRRRGALLRRVGRRIAGR